MSYRLPASSATSCSSPGCATAASYDDRDPGTRAVALAGWELGAETAVCPDHRRRLDVLHFAG